LRFMPTESWLQTIKVRARALCSAARERKRERSTVN
jgi:hypothetical protein